MEEDKSRTYEEPHTQISAKELSVLLKVSSALASTLELSEILQIAIESVTDLFHLESGAIYTLENGILILGATTPPLPPGFPKELRIAHLLDHPHINKAISIRAPIYLPDARTATLSPAEQAIVTSRHLISILYFPLLLKDDAIGVYIVGTTGQPRRFTSNEIDLNYMLSFQVSLAIANAQLYQKAQQAITNLTQAYDATLAGWSRVLDMRDHATDEHTHRVADLAVLLAKKTGIPESELGHIFRGALLHDIGKIAIPDSILQKEKPLTDDEQAIMQTHPQKAYQIMSQIDYLLPAIDIPYCHHERWDGTGYPRKLKGEEIPLAARLFTVVDVFDAVTSNRPYRQAWTKADALLYIHEQAGKQFDPQVVEVFLELMGKNTK